MSTQQPESFLKSHLLDSKDSLSEKFKAIGHPVRLHILIHLLDKGDSFNDIMNEIGKFSPIGSSSLAHHLNSLENERLIVKIKRGEYELTSFAKNLLYFLNQDSIDNTDSVASHIVPEEKLVTGNPVYQPCWNSFVSSLSGILNSLQVNYDFIEVGGRTGSSFPIVFGTQNFDYKTIGFFNDETFNEILTGIESFGFRVHLIEKNKTFTDNWQMNDDDFKKALETYNEIQNVICTLNVPVMLYGVRSSMYGIVKGYKNDSYIVSTFYRTEGHADTPVRFDSIFVNNVFRYMYFTQHESIPMDEVPDYKVVVERALKMLKGDTITKDGFVAGPQAFDVWITKLSTDQNPKHSFFGRYYHDARMITTEFLERVGRASKNKNQAESLFNASKEHRKVKNLLEDFMMIFPFYEPNKIVFTDENIQKSVEIFSEAKEHEELAIKFIEEALAIWE